MSGRKDVVAFTVVMITLYFIADRWILIALAFVVLLYFYYIDRYRKPSNILGHGSQKFRSTNSTTSEVLSRSYDPSRSSNYKVTNMTTRNDPQVQNTQRYNYLYQQGRMLSKRSPTKSVKPDSFVGNMPHVVLRSSTVKPIKTPPAKLRFAYDVKTPGPIGFSISHIRKQRGSVDVDNGARSNPTTPISVTSTPQKSIIRTKRLIETLEKKRPQQETSDIAVKRKKKSHPTSEMIFATIETNTDDTRTIKETFTNNLIEQVSPSKFIDCPSPESERRQGQKKSLSTDSFPSTAPSSSRAHRPYVKGQRPVKSYKSNEILSSYSSIENLRHNKRKMSFDSDDDLNKKMYRKQVTESMNVSSESESKNGGNVSSEKLTDTSVDSSSTAAQSSPNQTKPLSSTPSSLSPARISSESTKAELSGSKNEEEIEMEAMGNEIENTEAVVPAVKEEYKNPEYIHTMEEHARDIEKNNKRLDHFLKALGTVDDVNS